jgi:hypothetical protein
MKPKAPKQTRAETAAVLAAWLAIIVAATTTQVEAATEVIPFGYAAESYLDFGLPWMFLRVLAYGLLMGAAYQMWLTVIKHRELAVSLVTVIFWMGLYIFERSWVKTLGSTITIMVYLGGFTYLLDQYLLMRRAQAGASGADDPLLAR